VTCAPTTRAIKPTHRMHCPSGLPQQRLYLKACEACRRQTPLAEMLAIVGQQPGSGSSPTREAGARRTVLLGVENRALHRLGFQTGATARETTEEPPSSTGPPMKSRNRAPRNGTNLAIAKHRFHGVDSPRRGGDHNGSLSGRSSSTIR